MDDGTGVHRFGNTGKFLQSQTGDPSFDDIARLKVAAMMRAVTGGRAGADYIAG